MGDIAIRKVDEIRKLYEGIKVGLKKTIEDVITIGELLCKVEDELDHGQFGNWIEDNFEFSYKTAKRWMNVYENKKAVLKELKKDNRLLLTDIYNSVSAKAIPKKETPKLAPAKRCMTKEEAKEWKKGSSELENYSLMARNGQVFVLKKGASHPAIVSYVTIEQLVGLEEALEALNNNLQEIFTQYYADVEAFEKQGNDLRIVVPADAEIINE